MFDTEGRRVTNLDQIMDGGIYICSSSKRFLPGNYGSYGEKTEFRDPDFQINENMIPDPSCPSCFSHGPPGWSQCAKMAPWAAPALLI